MIFRLSQDLNSKIETGSSSENPLDVQNNALIQTKVHD